MMSIVESMSKSDKLKALKKAYPAGTRVRIIKMDKTDDEPVVPKGTMGTVVGVNEYAEIDVDWDNGDDAPLIFLCDSFEAIKPTEKKSTEKKSTKKSTKNTEKESAPSEDAE